MYYAAVGRLFCISRLDEDLAFSCVEENDDDESVLDKFPNLALATYDCGLASPSECSIGFSSGSNRFCPTTLLARALASCQMKR